MDKKQKYETISAWINGGGLFWYSLRSISDWVREYIMRLNPIFSTALFFVFLFGFLISLAQKALRYAKDGVTKKQIILIYIVPIIIISFSFGGFLSGLRENKKMTPLDVPATDEITSSPTSIKLQFNDKNALPVEISKENIFSWYSFYNIVGMQEIRTDGKIDEEFLREKTWTIFLLFENPINIDQILINGHGGKMPRYEVKQSSSKHAIIYFYGDLVGLVLSIEMDTDVTR